MKMNIGFKIWGYLSRRCNALLQYSIQAGIMEHVIVLNRNQFLRVANSTNQTKTIRSEFFIQTRPFTLKSTLGITAQIQLGVMADVTLAVILQMVWHNMNPDLVTKFNFYLKQLRSKLKIRNWKSNMFRSEIDDRM